MKVLLLVLGFAVLGAWGCTVVEEIPTKPSLITVGGQPVQPSGGNPSPIPSPSSSPSPSPRPSATPTPTPSPSATPTPSPTQPSPSPTPSPRPSATPSPALPASTIDSIRVGFFGINCGRGNPVPRNGEKLLPRGCRGYVTASPKDRNGDDVPLSIHGPDIDWFVLDGDDKIAVEDPTFASDFNKDIVGVREGTFGLCATVREVTGCLMGTVIPR
jgi:hypothetical protein